LILLIDNYDSFVYNLSRYFVEMGCSTRVVRNDAVTVDEVRAMRPAAIVLSPGPCTPSEAGVCVDVVRRLSGEIPLLGVCLGHQAIASAYGGTVERASEPVHGRISRIEHTGGRLFAGLPNPLRATRYHSLVVRDDSLPDELVATSHTQQGVLMSCEHRSLPVFGVQFHPESVLTEGGHRLLHNFLGLAGIDAAPCPVGEYVEQPHDLERSAGDADYGPPLHW
jgi:anthranilate synthase/aminodeoxychorismate synthase-like glutamine amidotransferase